MSQLTLTITMEDLVFELNISSSATGRQLKEAIFSMIGLPVDNQLVHFQGKILHDQMSLQQQGVSNNDLIELYAQENQPNPPPAQNRAPQNVSDLSANLSAMFQQARNAQRQPAPQPSSGPITSELFQQALSQVTAAPQGPNELSAEQLQQHFLNNPDALEQLSMNNPQMADAILNNNVPALQQMVQTINERQREQRRRRQEFIDRVNANPFDVEAQRMIEEEIRQEMVNQNMEQAFEHNPEAFGRVVMLYIDCKVNNTPVKAFVDSGAQITLMSAEVAERCGIMRFVDRRFANTLVGVGSCKAIGRVHIASVTIGNSVYTSSFTIVEDSKMEFLLGLDMLRKHRCVIDLAKNVLRFNDGEEEVPFLSEQDIPNTFLHRTEISEEKIETLMQMGFSREKVIQVLEQSGGDENLAASILSGT